MGGVSHVQPRTRRCGRSESLLVSASEEGYFERIILANFPPCPPDAFSNVLHPVLCQGGGPAWTTSTDAALTLQGEERKSGDLSTLPFPWLRKLLPSLRSSNLGIWALCYYWSWATVLAFLVFYTLPIILFKIREYDTVLLVGPC